ncbi:pentatricopeptide repeat-containing protein At2g17033 [Quercus suber]|uniref:Pentatricopeptide repeat-containing protein n=1 Tax=Quercus suber TaxID=58331 RepID=A0AAW0KJH7_QUESU|nr:pentatricopeptide repeat-containing protein At2g17033 [Quercus suber]POE65845.1 isoform 3 of pentatricopeptide repeat-containing protein [Quercus suber]
MIVIGLGGNLKLPLPLPCNLHQPPQKLTSKLLSPKCALTKQAHRFLSTLSTTARDPSASSSATHKLIQKFVATSPKSVSLNTLSHLLTPHTSYPHLSALALPFYKRITEATWFDWNPKLVADLVALLDKQGRYEESEKLISEAVSKIELRERELVLFYCNLVESHSKQGSKRGFDVSFTRLNRVVDDSSSAYVKQRGFEAMVSGLCEMGQVCEAEKVFDEMRVRGVKVSRFEFRCVLYGYGRLGLFEDMERVVNLMESEGFVADTICCNMILSAYGCHCELARMVLWLRKMRASQISFSIRTYNSVLNSCPTIMSMMVQDMETGMDTLPLSIGELSGVLSGDEALVVKELVESNSVLEEVMTWDSLEGKLDLHGMHLGSCYLMMLKWMEELQNGFKDGKYVIPREITLVCGLGKHSNVRGESPVKILVRKMLVRLKSPMRNDRKNVGCFVAKGKVVRDWLC